ncbi:MAG: tetratricopeptide repeat protein [Mongoliitalea sp.]
MNKQHHISQEQFEQIENYILGKLTEQEKESFEIALQTDPSLQDKVQEVKGLMEALEEAGLRASMEEFHQVFDTELALDKPVKRLNPWFGVAAAVITLLILAGVWVLIPTSTIYEDLFESYYVEDPGLITAMSSESDYEFDRAMVDYKSGNFKDAVTRWQQILELKPENDTLNYFLGAAHLALNETGTALDYFEKVSQLPQGRFTNDTFWYLALVYLKQGKVEAAKMSLEKTEHPQKGQLLETLQEK